MAAVFEATGTSSPLPLSTALSAMFGPGTDAFHIVHICWVDEIWGSLRRVKHETVKWV